MMIPAPNDTPEAGIYIGDARRLADEIADESVDLILCDPVYSRPDDYAWLAALAARVLRQGGSVVAQTGNIHRLTCELAMLEAAAGRLEPRPLLMEIFTGGFPTLWMHRALGAGRPYLWFEKGQPSRDRGWVPTCFFGSKDKRLHRWGDGVAAYALLIERLTAPGDLVLDPFTGSGTVPAACAALWRRYIAFEIDAATAATARERLRCIQPPLFVVDDNGGQLPMEDM